MSEREESTMSASDQPALVEVEIMTIRRRWKADQMADQMATPHVVVLEERGGTRHLPLFLEPGACQALAQMLTQPALPPPPTYALATALVTAAGGSIREVVLTHLADGVVYATVLLDRAGELQRVDARPSDALNIALLARVPMRVQPTVFAAVEAALTEYAQEARQDTEGPWTSARAETLAIFDGSWKEWRITDA
jgi:bifunctional DNase/RNase